MLGQSYAVALVEIAQEAGDLDQVHQDMDMLAGILAGDSAVRPFFLLLFPYPFRSLQTFLIEQTYVP